MLVAGSVLLVVFGVYAYQAIEQNNTDCQINAMTSAIIGQAPRDCDTGAPIGAWFAIGAAILLIIAGLVVLALAPSKRPVHSHLDSTLEAAKSSETTKDRLLSLRNQLDQGQITVDDFKSRRDGILDDLYKS